MTRAQLLIRLDRVPEPERSAIRQVFGLPSNQPPRRPAEARKLAAQGLRMLRATLEKP